MEKKTECEIVQDLLFSYADDVLNEASRKLVEKHLMECEKCREKLNEIQDERKEHCDIQKEQIDYLKKIRRRNKIKSFLWAVLILGVMFAGWYLRQFCILSGIAGKVEKQFESENFYAETISSCDEDTVSYTKTWYKDGKYKVVSYIEKEEEITQKFETRYGNLKENPKEEYFVEEEEKKVRKEKTIHTNSKYDFCYVKNPIFLSNQPHYMAFRFGAPFYVKISKDYEEIGRWYYVLEMDHGKQWIDIETGLPIMSFGYSSTTQYYKDTKIPLKKSENISEYHYEFETVTEEDVELPNLEGYEFLELDWEAEVQKAKNRK